MRREPRGGTAEAEASSSGAGHALLGRPSARKDRASRISRSTCVSAPDFKEYLSLRETVAIIGNAGQGFKEKCRFDGHLEPVLEGATLCGHRTLWDVRVRRLSLERS